LSSCGRTLAVGSGYNQAPTPCEGLAICLPLSWGGWESMRCPRLARFDAPDHRDSSGSFTEVVVTHDAVNGDFISVMGFEVNLAVCVDHDLSESDVGIISGLEQMVEFVVYVTGGDDPESISFLEGDCTSDRDGVRGCGVRAERDGFCNDEWQASKTTRLADNADGLSPRAERFPDIIGDIRYEYRDGSGTDCKFDGATAFVSSLSSVGEGADEYDCIVSHCLLVSFRLLPL
jgi:hypothetical protein